MAASTPPLSGLTPDGRLRGGPQPHPEGAFVSLEKIAFGKGRSGRWRARKPLDAHPDDGWQLADPWPMDENTRTAFHALIRAIMPPPPAPQPDHIVERIELGIRRILPYMATFTAVGFGAVVHFLDWAPVWRLKRAKRLRDLTPAEGSAVLKELAATRSAMLRNVLMGARGSILSMYFDQPEVQEAMGYHPVRFTKERVDLHNRLREGGQWDESDRLGPFSPDLPADPRVGGEAANDDALETEEAGQ